MCGDIHVTVTTLPVAMLSIRSALCGSILHSNNYYIILAGTCLVSAASGRTIHQSEVDTILRHQPFYLSDNTLHKYAHVLIYIQAGEGSQHFSYINFVEM